VFPPAAASARRRLLAALEQAFPVRFEPREHGAWDGLDAGIVFGPEHELGASAPVPCLVYDSPDEESHTSFPAFEFTDSPSLDRRLRGRRLVARHRGNAGVLPANGDEVLALRGARPAWVLRAGSGPRTAVAALAPTELGPQEPLKRQLRAGNFLALLPLVHFLRELATEHGWQPPPLRATFVFEDPNLRWTSYGHLDYRELAAHAERHRYHAGIAMIPLDAGLVHRRTAELFAGRPDRLSVLVHGINHERKELMRSRTPRARRALMARALRRIEQFESRSGIHVSRVMSAPHGVAAEDFLNTMLRFGIEAFLAGSSLPWRGGEVGGPALAGWSGARFAAGGLPLLIRYSLMNDPDEIVLRAFLDQPLILYGHHEDVANGLEPLERIASLVNSLGPTSWCSTERIARTNFHLTRESDALVVRLLSRKVEIDVGSDTRLLRVQIPPVEGGAESSELVLGRMAKQVQLDPDRPTTVELEASPGSQTLELRPQRRINHRATPAAHGSATAVVRRLLTEGRDRLRPLVR
jgi:hypothetical protein